MLHVSQPIAVLPNRRVCALLAVALLGAASVSSTARLFTRPGAPPVRARMGGRQRDLAAFVEALATPHRVQDVSLDEEVLERAGRGALGAPAGP